MGDDPGTGLTGVGNEDLRLEEAPPTIGDMDQVPLGLSKHPNQVAALLGGEIELFAVRVQGRVVKELHA